MLEKFRKFKKITIFLVSKIQKTLYIFPLKPIFFLTLIAELSKLINCSMNCYISVNTLTYITTRLCSISIHYNPLPFWHTYILENANGRSSKWFERNRFEIFWRLQIHYPIEAQMHWRLSWLLFLYRSYSSKFIKPKLLYTRYFFEEKNVLRMVLFCW